MEGLLQCIIFPFKGLDDDYIFKSTALVFCWFEAQVSASGTFAAIIALEQDFDFILHTQFTAFIS